MENTNNEGMQSSVHAKKNIQQDDSLFMYNKQYKKGAILFKQGENSKDVYILNSGVLEVIVDDAPVALIDQRGVFFGEMASILNEVRNATVKVKEDCNCIVIPANYVNNVIAAKPEIGFNLIRVLAKRLKDTTRSLTTIQKAYILQKQEILKLKGKLNEAGLSAQKTPYDFMVEINLITEEDLNTAKLEQQKRKEKGQNITIANILIEQGKAAMNDIIQAIQTFKESVEQKK